MTHFHVGHFDDVITCSSRDTGDGKLTRSWENGHEQNADTLTAKKVKGLNNPLEYVYE